MRLAAAALFAILAVQEKPELGKVCPDLKLKSLDGKEIKLAEFRKADKQEGSIVVIVFWSFKCPSGKAVHSRLAEGYPELEKDGVKIVNICSYGESADELKEFVQKNDIKYSLYPDEDTSAAKALGAKVVTHAIVLDAEGKVAYIGGIFRKGYDAIQAAKDLKAGKPLKETEAKAKG